MVDSKIYRNGEYIYINDDNSKSTKSNKMRNIDLNIYYPRVNDKSVYENYKSLELIMKAITISVEGITLLSKIPLMIGDFINFSLTLGNHPSFWCLCEVKFVQYEDTSCKAQCEFYSLTMEQINIIKEYVSSI